MIEDFHTVKIGNMYYRVTANDDSDYVKSIAKKANEMIGDLKSKHSGLSDLAAAVLALLNALDQREKIGNRDSDVYQKVSLLQKDLQEVEADRLRLREELWEVKKDLLYYRNLCEVYEEKLSNMVVNLPSSTAKPSRKRKEKPSPLEQMQQSFEDMEVYDD